MAFAKFNICQPCCSTSYPCQVNVTLHTCSQTGTWPFPAYINDIPSGDLYLTLASCTGGTDGFCNCLVGATSPTGMYEIYYPLVNTASSGKHSFGYNFDNLYNVVVASTGGNFVDRNYGIYTSNLSCYPACTGNLDIQIFPTKWFGGNPLWWSNQYGNRPMTFNYDRSNYQAYMAQQNGNMYCYSYYDISIQPAGYTCNYLCFGSGALDYLCSVGTLNGMYTTMNYNVPSLSFVLNNYREITPWDSSINGFPASPGSTGWVSDLYLEYAYIFVEPSGTTCGDQWVANNGRTTVYFNYVSAIAMSADCNATSVQLYSSIAPSAIPNIGQFSFLHTYINNNPNLFGNQSAKVFVSDGVMDTTASDALNFLNSLPTIIAATGNYKIYIEVYPGSVHSWSSSNSGVVNYYPGYMKLQNKINLTNCAMPTITGYDYIEVIQ